MYLDIKEVIKHLPRIAGVEYRPSEIGDVDNIAAVEFWGLTSEHLAVLKQTIEIQRRYGAYSLTVHLHNKPVALFGCILMWHGVAELWALLSKDTFKRPLALSKCALTFADICEISLKLHRLQIHVKSSNERAVKWGEFLGFSIEGKLIQFTQDKQDCYIMSRR
jgi:hypothetical protein